MVLEKLIELLCEQLDIEADEVNENTDIVNDLGADSLDVVDLVMTLEDEFDIEFPDRLLQKSTFSSISAIAAEEASLAETTFAAIVLSLRCWCARQRRSPEMSWYFSPTLRTTMGCISPSARMLSASSASAAGSIALRGW